MRHRRLIILPIYNSNGTVGLTVEMMAEIFSATAQIYEGKIKRFLYEVNYRPIQLVYFLHKFNRNAP